ncbi:uncharacterized protein LOC126354830 [Schistocerca gregaria]|uniref:uncharacterized protein LOC126354830 n=1 Tax=Schistocerca gregaria TaxID=7010 RepID=UPI00211E68FD|nr:uncharacterized protein LOC126354830 [Schistocerca gregaria]
MADISKDELRKEIAAILKDADLTSTSSKKVRQQIEEKLDVDLSDRKKEVDDLVMECLKEKQDGKKKNSKDEDEEEDEEEEEEEEEDEEEEDEKPKAKRAAKKPTKRPKKGSSEESDEGSDDDASDEEYNPSKKSKGASPKKGKPPAKKKKGSDSDSDEDWAKARKSSSGGGGGGGGAKKKGGAKRGGGGGYIKAKSLSPELAALMGQDSMPRHEVVKKIWGIIKERNLYDPKNKQFAICDDELMKVFGVKRFRMFGMMKYLKNHFVD